MWTVLLIEDERFIRESIREIVNWKEMNFNIIGEASNGEEGLEFIQRHRPDLVVSDILMPKMTGVELLKKTRELGILSKFIMLTSMNEFEYVREALEYGASNYILKLSMSIASFRESIEKVALELGSGNRNSIRDMNPFYEEHWRRLYDEDNGLAPLHEKLPTELYGHKVTVVSILHGKETYTVQDFHELKVINPDPEAKLHIFTDYGHTTVFYWSLRSIRLNPVTGPVVAVNNADPAELPAVWRNNMDVLDKHWYITWEKTQNRTNRKLWREERKLYEFFEQHHKQNCLAAAEAILEIMAEESLPMAEAKRAMKKIIKTLADISGQPWNDHELNYAKDFRLFSALFLTQLEERIDSMIRALGPLTDHQEVNKVIEYILQNYHEDIHAKEMAKYVVMDETYFSNLFKKKTGETFIKFLHRVRLEKAIHYLHHTDLTVQEIAVKVGFNNINYFNRIFKRFTSQTPSDYRKIHHH